MIIYYKGTLITKKSESLYTWGNRSFVSLYLAKLYVDKVATKALEKSIVK